MPLNPNPPRIPPRPRMQLRMDMEGPRGSQEQRLILSPRIWHKLDPKEVQKNTVYPPKHVRPSLSE